jgi:hypothetical protein
LRLIDDLENQLNIGLSRLLHPDGPPKENVTHRKIGVK